MEVRALIAPLTIAATLLFTPSPSMSTSADLDCLAKNVYFEARGEPRIDQEAVAHVVVNRVQSGRFRSSVCGVVHQSGQFSWTFDRNSDVPRERAAWNRSLQVAQGVLSGEIDDPTDGATYFWHRRLNPSWTRRLVPTLRTNSHVYARPNRG